MSIYDSANSDVDDTFLSCSSIASSESCDLSYVSLSSNLNNEFSNCHKTLNVVHINAQSIPAHYSDMLTSFDNNHIHAVLVSESWLKPSLDSSFYPLPGFQLIRNDRINKRAGGVAIYLRSHIPYTIVSKSPSEYSEKAEHLLIEVRLGYTRMLLGVCYSPSMTINYFSSFEKLLDDFSPLFDSTIVMGDFNTCLLKNDSRSNSLTSIVQSKNLHFLPLQATHHPPNSEPTLLDLIIVSSPDHVLKHGQFTADCFSYHDLLYLSYKVRTPKPKKRTILQRNFKNMDIQRLLEDAKDIEWARLNDIDNIDERVELFNSLLTNLFDKHAPLRPVRVKQLPAPWLTDKIKGLMTKRDHAKYRYKKQPTDDNLCAYKELRNRCNRVCRDAKRRYIHTSIENCENSQLWNFLKTLGIGKIKATSNIDINLSALNKHFSTPPLILSDQIRTETLNHLSDMPVPDCPPFNFKLVTGRDVKRCISAITSKAVGTDDISANMINSVLDIILPHITNLMNLSLISSSFPSLWKNAFILPLPKIPSPTSLTQFRPISILPFLSKVLERLVFEQFSSFLSGNQLLNSYQSGFRPGHSTVTALIKVTDDIRYNIDNQNVTVLALLDFSNAFNSVDFDLLLGTIRSLNVSPAVTSWFETYLKGRQQCVRTDTETSSWCPVLAGVPQGGVLSPLLFSLFINILASKLTSLYHLYADDLQLYTGVPPESLNTAVSLINDNLAIISKWVKSFGLLLNPSKSQAIVLGSSRMLNKIDFATAARIRYDQIDIPYVTSVKNLGVIMDSTLSWIPQVDAVSRKMFASFHSLKRLQYFLPFMTKITLAQSLLLPILDYADVSYLDLTEELLNKLERLQNLCIRFIFGLRKYDHISEYRARLKWLPIRLRRNTHILCLLYNVLNNPSSPAYLKCKFSFLCSHSHGRELRSQENKLLSIPNHNAASYSDSFAMKAASLWNSLPVSVRLSPSLATFKINVKKHYFNTLGWQI
ncbi:hypothetical protein JYU34_004547 [Plutella xylostella]|uniref:Reverse transcriptase domain-containing protein n=1 Tax=Plutella xylostella TaxID=51655 RepID=A0ABQ7QYE3_PLUXY|nr:hypothetical protein JYU34_004547 [Plutella xylostella]